MGVVALQLKPEQKLFTIVVVSALVFGFLIWAKLFISSSRQPDQDSG
jgi:Flp pilus assembly protein protease CpaA